MRRLVLAALTLALAVSTGAALAQARASRPQPLASKPSLIALENRKVGSEAWSIAEAGDHQIEGYASEVSVLPGQNIHLHVSTAPAASYRVDFYRLGWYRGRGGRLLACLPSCTGSLAGATEPLGSPDATGLLDANWPVTISFKVPVDWLSGYYLAVLGLTSGPAAGGGTRIPFVVREPKTRRAQILIQVPVNTWQAYNEWGGRSLYVPSQYANNHVSFNRPYAVPPFSDGSPQQWEMPLMHFLERNGYDVAYQTDADTDRQPATLFRQRLVIVIGHDEYWTRTMRTSFEKARDAGINLAFFGANDAYWQMRYADETRRVIVEYRKPGLDPEPDPALKTQRFRTLDPTRSECTLVGVQFQDSPRADGTTSSLGSEHDYTVATTADPWFAHTGFTAGATLKGLVGAEWDNIDPFCLSGPETVLFHYQGLPANADAVRYKAPSAATVFAAGSLQFVYGLDTNHFLPERVGLEDQRLKRFVKNMLVDLLKPRARR